MDVRFAAAYPVAASAFVFGCSAYLAARLAASIYEKDAPMPDGPAPSTVPVLLLVAVAAAVGAVSAWRGTDLANLALALLIVSALCAVTWTDVTRGFVGDWFTLPPLAVVFAFGIFEHALIAMALAVLFVTLPFAVAAIVSKGMGMGWGDVKLVALGAAVLDLETSVVVYAAACLVACAVALARRRRREPIAFAPYLAAAIALGLVLPAPSHLG